MDNKHRSNYNQLQAEGKWETISVDGMENGVGEIEMTREGILTQSVLDDMNVPQEALRNKQRLDEFGGEQALLRELGVDPHTGLSEQQVALHSKLYGVNTLPARMSKSFAALIFDALKDPVLLILIVAAIVSIVLGTVVERDLQHGWIEGAAICIAVIIVSSVSAGNDYTKELQFRALEQSSRADERTTVLRGGERILVPPGQLTVGDVVVLQSGERVSADGVLIDNVVVRVDESSLTGEAEEQRKSSDSDPFLLSSCTVQEVEGCAEARMIVFGVGHSSQWGRIRAALVSGGDEEKTTPLQDKLEDLAKKIGFVGLAFAVLIFVVLIANSFVGPHATDKPEASQVVDAFVVAITVVVVAIPEGLPLAVTIALAYSTRKMYEQHNLIRVLAACETMGNATQVCTDKTGTLTQNRMMVVEGWFGDAAVPLDCLTSTKLTPLITEIVCENACINRVANLIRRDSNGQALNRPLVKGSATEGALILMAEQWGFDYEVVQTARFKAGRDRFFPFNSTAKRSSVVLHRDDGRVRLYTKGASEYVLADCTHFINQMGEIRVLTHDKRVELNAHIERMAEGALRTLCLAHKDFDSRAALPKDWEETGVFINGLVLNAVVGIADPLRDDVKEAVATAQSAGVFIRMVTGDNVHTAKAIARQCGILSHNGVVLEGPAFRNMSPRELDEVLPRLQVLARASPEDKYLLVVRLNGRGLPTTKVEWEAQHSSRSWENERDALLPGYKDEWLAARPEGAQVVAVTGDGSNDAPALRAADVGLAMGSSGTAVARDASDVVILDDKFSSIVNAIMWGRTVYDAVRKFLQFQLTVNVVALVLVLVGSASGFDPPLNAVMMLWVNLIMDSFGALALATEPPTAGLLRRKPYKRSASLISRPMIRNILVHAIAQLVLLFVLLFDGADRFRVDKGSPAHFTIIFNAFVFWQVFNQFNSRILGDDVNIFRGLQKNPMFGAVVVITVCLQAFIVEVGGGFSQTVSLTRVQWAVTIALGLLAWPVGLLSRFIPVQEDPKSFFELP